MKLRFVIVLFPLIALVAAQPPKEDEDPKQKGKTPNVIDIEKDPPRPNEKKTKEGPGVVHGPGVLVVGVRQLPEHMSPTGAQTSSEKLAVDLIFEGLMRPAPDPIGGWRYEPVLATSLPQVVAQGRAFELVHDAVWAGKTRSDQRVVAVDVLSTMEKIKARGSHPGGERGDWSGESVSDAATRVRLTIRQGHPDPLSLMTFPITPNDRADDELFAREPVGSGPFIYSGRVVEGERAYAVFAANPQYGNRTERKNTPQLKEIRLLVCA